MKMKFPCFRKLAGADTLYAIEGPRHVMEWQPMGDSKWLIHKHYASDYPRYQWIQELLHEEGEAQAISQEEWQVSLARRTGSEEAENIPQVLNDWSFKANTTFGVDATAKRAVEVESDADVRWVLEQTREAELPLLVLGGGSNVLLHNNWNGLVLKMAMKGVQVLSDDGRELDVVVGAGEGWHEWVMHALDEGWNGLENLALIPGSVGASPMQNIGAYGVEVKDRFLWLEAIHQETGALERFDFARCEFGYRDSIFKQAERDQWVIVRVAFRLDREAPLQTEYGAIRQELQACNVESPSHRDVAEAVMRIRTSKLPDPSVLGNAGSFFKNPILDSVLFDRVKQHHPHVVHYPLEDGRFKLAAGWLIDQAGWKGHRRNRCGVHDRQALVLVNYGGATGQEIWSLAQDIIADVQTKFGVQLEPEVNQIQG